jgi:hypothetical protein
MPEVDYCPSAVPGFLKSDENRLYKLISKYRYGDSNPFPPKLQSALRSQPPRQYWELGVHNYCLKPVETAGLGSLFSRAWLCDSGVLELRMVHKSDLRQRALFAPAPLKIGGRLSPDQTGVGFGDRVAVKELKRQREPSRLLVLGPVTWQMEPLRISFGDGKRTQATSPSPATGHTFWGSPSAFRPSLVGSRPRCSYRPGMSSPYDA